MILDIVAADDGKDLEIKNSQVQKAGNILSVQLGSLEYAPDFGVDIAYFLREDLQFQNQSFQSYCVQALTNRGLNVASVLPSVQTLMEKYTFNLTPDESSTAMLAR